MTHILIALLKAHNIKRVVAGPQDTQLIAGIRQDAFFEVYEAEDERSAGYIACGIAAEAREPVVLACSGLSAFRSCMPPLTEAFYRQLPVLALTVGHEPSSSCTLPISTTSIPRDCAKFRLHVPALDTPELAHEYTVRLNEALLELTHDGGGPVHVDIADFCVSELPDVQVIDRIGTCDKVMPPIKAERVGVFVGAHSRWNEKLTSLADAFCEAHNAAVLCTCTSNYHGKYGVNAALSRCGEIDLMVHIGRASGDGFLLKPREVWRVHPDGAVHDVFGKLRYVFEMREEEFFSRYVSSEHGVNTEYYSALRKDCASVPELPFSSAWIAHTTAPTLPPNSALHLSTQSALKAWSFVCLPETVSATSNTSTAGSVSALLGASLAAQDKLCFGVVDGSAFFLSMNAAGSRHRGPNLRIMVISSKSEHSEGLLRDYASDLGFEYLSASDKQEYAEQLGHFTAPEMHSKPVFFEVFTDTQDEEQALSLLDQATGGMNR